MGMSRTNLCTSCEKSLLRVFDPDPTLLPATLALGFLSTPTNCWVVHRLYRLYSDWAAIDIENIQAWASNRWFQHLKVGPHTFAHRWSCPLDGPYIAHKVGPLATQAHPRLLRYRKQWALEESQTSCRYSSIPDFFYPIESLTAILTLLPMSCY